MEVLGTILGVLVGFFISYFFYRRSTKELEKQANRLKLASDLILYKLQYPSAETEIKRDDSGDVIGLKVFMET
ncbi:hypothetical protein OAB88_04435 [Winogradskyella sp.]|jgi:hypothetical protein|nr:hypothetical protein [Winogradskyella sp.]